MRNRFETLGDIDDPEEEHDMIFGNIERCSKERRGEVKEPQQAMDRKQNMGKDQGEKAGKIEIGDRND